MFIRFIISVTVAGCILLAILNQICIAHASAETADRLVSHSAYLILMAAIVTVIGIAADKIGK